MHYLKYTFYCRTSLQLSPPPAPPVVTPLKLVSTISKSGSYKCTLRIKIYRSYQSYKSILIILNHFESILNQKRINLSSTTHNDCERKTFLSLFNKHAFLKKKILRHNNVFFMTKELRKEIMKRSKLKNKYDKSRNYRNWFFYKKQRSHCLTLLRKTRKAYFEKLNIKETGCKKTFWETVRPYFSKTTLVKKRYVLAHEKRIAELMKKCLIDITKSLNLKAPIVNTTDDIQSLKKVGKVISVKVK